MTRAFRKPHHPRQAIPGAGRSCARPWALFLALALLAVGCRTSAEVQIASSASAYEWHLARYVEACAVTVGPEDCGERHGVLVRWRASLEEASSALARWGKAEEQIENLKRCRKEAGKWSR